MRRMQRRTRTRFVLACTLVLLVTGLAPALLEVSSAHAEEVRDVFVLGDDASSNPSVELAPIDADDECGVVLSQSEGTAGAGRWELIEDVEPTKVTSFELSRSSYTYNGKARKPAVIVKAGDVVVPASGYSVSYKNNVNVGTATVTVTGKGDYKGTVKKTFKITKAANPMAVKAVTRKAKLATVKKKAVVVAAPLKFAKEAVGKVTYARVAKGSSASLSVDKSTGKVTVKKGSKKGTYKVKVKVRAAGNANYKKVSKTITCKVVVK